MWLSSIAKLCIAKLSVKDQVINILGFGSVQFLSSHTGTVHELMWLYSCTLYKNSQWTKFGPQS